MQIINKKEKSISNTLLAMEKMLYNKNQPPQLNEILQIDLSV
jgi:hypothetical protein